jgi:hypothetical protein
MASLRTAFIDSFRQGDNIFYTFVTYFPIIFNPAVQSEELTKEKKVVERKKVSTNEMRVRMPSLVQSSPSLRALQGLVSMNINNFSHLLDGYSNDFKDC